MELSVNEKKELLRIARRTIESYLVDGCVPEFDVTEPGLLEKRGAFVSLHRGPRLRGCIGMFESDKSLYQTVAEMAFCAAMKDPRFSPLTEEELDELSIEISVLTPMRRVENATEVEVGRHGVLIVKGNHRGVLLPQVATEHGLEREGFLDETCLKAGLEPGAWRHDAEIYVFEATVFNEKDLP